MKINSGISGAAVLLALLTLAGCTTAPANGRDTREWLNLQKGGSAASAEPQALSGEAADKIYKRYVDSFGSPLPETFPREDFTEGQSGGGS